MRSWRRLVFEPSAEADEELIVALHERGSIGIERAAGRIEAYFIDPVDEALLLAGLDSDLAVWGPPRLLASEQVADGFWHERWVAGLRPMPVGRGFLVVAGPATPAEPTSRHIIRITPGSAFGTGEHATTRACLELIEEHLRPGWSMLDVGTGSGILAIAAKKAGAGRVVAIDIDEEAVRVAARNALLNETPGIQLAVCGPQALAVRRFDLVAANIAGATLLRVMPALAGLTGHVGIFSGLLREDEADVAGAARAAGLAPLGRVAEGDWVTLCAVQEEA